MKDRSLFVCIKRLLYAGCLIFAYGILGSLEIDRLTLSQTLNYLFGAAGLCLGINLLHLIYRLTAVLLRCGNKKRRNAVSASRRFSSVRQPAK